MTDPTPTIAEDRLPLALFAEWLASGERGLSSEAIVSHLTGAVIGRRGRRGDYPHDPSDFRRCQALLTSVPAARAAFSRMRDASPTWARMVDAWDEIDSTFEREVPNYASSDRRWSAPLTYALMRRVISGAGGGRGGVA